MRLTRVFVDLELQIDSNLILPPDKGHYLKNVLRLKNAQEIALFNGKEARDYIAEIAIQGKQVSARISSSIDKLDDVKTADIVLIQAAGKPEHLDFVIQKGTELGVKRFIIFNAARTQSPLKGNRLQKKLAHWIGISISASEQCNRNSIPEIQFAANLASIIETESVNKLLLDFTGKSLIQLKPTLEARKSFHLLIGCEGGLTDEEITLAKKNGFKCCVTGPRTLRMETAAISIVSLVQHHFGDM